RKLLDGEPTVVVQNGQILEGALKRLNYNLDDLRMQLRSQGVFSMGEVEFAIVEPGGQLSVLKKSQLLPATPADLNIPTSYKGPATELIVDGHIVHANLEQLGLTEAWLVEQVRGRGHEMADVYYAELDTQGNLYIDLHDDLQHVPQENKAPGCGGAVVVLPPHPDGGEHHPTTDTRRPGHGPTQNPAHQLQPARSGHHRPRRGRRAGVHGMATG